MKKNAYASRQTLAIRLAMVLSTCLVACHALSVPPDNVRAVDAVAAFPGAEGYGALSIGGRGGQVIEVTSLDDDGPGTLRAAIETVGPRIVVFQVGGTIELRSPLEIVDPYITIAGQTAPGGGIALKTHPSMENAAIEVAAEHVIVRYIRVRPGPTTELSQNVDALVIGRGAKHVIIDHCSFSWSTDETISIWYDASDISIQWSIISEALLNSTHDAGPQSYGLLSGDRSTHISFHRNLLAHNNRRNPRIRGGNVDLVNNVIYNSGSTPSRLDGNTLDGSGAPASVNYVGNFIKPGPSSTFDYEVKLLDSENGTPFTAYVAGNSGPNRPDDSYPEQEIVHPDGLNLLVDNRHDAPLITTSSALEAYDQVLAGAGATLPVRDAIDARILDDVINGTGRIIDDPSDVGGWPALAMGRPRSDSDHDGMPDTWETDHGFDPNDAADGHTDANGDGYTNVEEYLNNTDPNVTPAETSEPTDSPTSTPTPPSSQDEKIYFPYLSKVPDVTRTKEKLTISPRNRKLGYGRPRLSQ